VKNHPDVRLRSGHQGHQVQPDVTERLQDGEDEQHPRAGAMGDDGRQGGHQADQQGGHQADQQAEQHEEHY
jgi:hypothetical protein